MIRTETDRGVILLLDDVFLKDSTETVSHGEWENCQLCSDSTLGAYMDFILEITQKFH